MALAILRFQDNQEGKNRFQVNIGTNRYYTYAIGNEEWRRTHGLQTLSNPKFTSTLIGPLAESSLGRTILEVPAQQFDRQNPYIQIISYRNQERASPAISEIVKIPVISLISSVSYDLPAISLSKEITMENHPVDTVPFAYKEVQPVSSAMFLGGLMSAIGSVAGPVLGALKSVAAPVLNVVKEVASPLLSSLAPDLVGKVAEKVVPSSGNLDSSVIPSLINILKGTSGSNTTVSADSSQLPAVLNNPTVAQKLSANPEVVQLLASLIQQLQQNTAEKKPQTAKAASALALVGNGRTANSNQSLLNLEQSLIPGATAQSLSIAQEVSPATSQYVEGMSVPVSLAYCVPSLMPLMDKVMTRKMRRMLMDDNIPEHKRMALITNGLMDVTRGFRGVRRNYRGRDNADFYGAGAFSLKSTDDNQQVNTLVSGLSVGLSAPDPTLNYDRVESVKLDFVEGNTLMMQGRPRLLYSQDETISFPLQVKTPRTITKGILQIIVKDPSTLEVLIEEKYRLKQITSGTLSVVPELSPERLASLEANEEYLVCAVLVWQGKSRKTNRTKHLGTSITQLITLVKEYCFDRIEGTAEVIPLNDVDRFRPYWHKIWEGEFSSSLRRTNLDCKYYYALEPGRNNNARMETVTQIESTIGTRQEGKLKTGLILSAYRLNELLGQISDYPMLDRAELTALLSSEFKEQFSHCARNSVEFKGRKGDTAGLWVYPEFKLQRVLLKQVEQTNENGQVLAFTEHTVYFPIPAIVHFIGVGN